MRKTPPFRGFRFFLASLVLATVPLNAETVRNHFDADSIVRPPGFFDFLVLEAPGKARWLVLSDRNPPSTPNKLSQVERGRPADSIAAAVRRNYAFQDGTVSTYIRQGSGRAGLILRMAGEKVFLLLLVDTASGEMVLTSYRDGKAAEIGRGRVPLARTWEKYSVNASGPKLSVFFNDEKQFDAVDPRPVSGRTALVAAGDAEASFDEFVLEFEPVGSGL